MRARTNHSVFGVLINIMKTRNRYLPWLVIFFLFGAPFAGAFELSVGAGLISVLFIIATSVADSAVDEVE